MDKRSYGSSATNITTDYIGAQQRTAESRCKPLGIKKNQAEERSLAMAGLSDL